jgi:hypothetical protein
VFTSSVRVNRLGKSDIRGVIPADYRARSLLADGGFGAAWFFVIHGTPAIVLADPDRALESPGDT